MRALNRNKQNIYYALFDKKVEILDEYGNNTGSSEVKYFDVENAKMNVSPARGTSELEQFGINTMYTRTLLTDDVNCPIKETTVLWIGYGNVSEYDESEIIADGEIRIKDGKLQKLVNDTWEEIPYNHVVVGIAKSLNSVVYAIKDVVVG